MREEEGLRPMPGIARKGDTNAPHCGGHNMATGSSTWWLDGRGVCRSGDTTTAHLTPPDKPPCPTHTTAVSPPNRGWYVDGQEVACFGDPHCTSIAESSEHWFAG